MVGLRGQWAGRDLPYLAMSEDFTEKCPLSRLPVTYKKCLNRQEAWVKQLSLFQCQVLPNHTVN